MLKSLLNFHKNHHSHPSYLGFLKGSIGMMLNPEGTQSVFEMEDGLLKSKSTEELLRFTSKDPAVDAMIKERYLQPVPDTTALGKLPKNTLGYKYFYHLDSMGFDPDYYRKIDVQNDTDYVMMRIRQTHDIWHIVTGFDTHPLGEIAIKAVELSQTHRPMAAAICAGGVFRYMLKEPELFGDCLESIVAGYHMGLQSKALLAMKWEELWDRDLDDLRERLGVIPVGPHGGKLSVDFSPRSSAVANKEAKAAIAEALKQFTQANPDMVNDDAGLNDHHDIGH